MTATLTLTSGTTGSVSSAQDVSAFTGDWTTSAVVVSCSPGSTALVALQTSNDGFASDIQTIWTYHIQPGTGNSVPLAAFRAYQARAARFGVASITARLKCEEIDGFGGSTVSVTATIS